ncbi:hypothetical protein V8G54_021575 [Vigna mungo]|uniref:Uncharacterized protein n=1 Tax=Vigna mungo TaxID=3915 RepID=A0AAQ3RUE8_VIGMU
MLKVAAQQSSLGISFFPVAKLKHGGTLSIADVHLDEKSSPSAIFIHPHDAITTTNITTNTLLCRFIVTKPLSLSSLSVLVFVVLGNAMAGLLYLMYLGELVVVSN